MDHSLAQSFIEDTVMSIWQFIGRIERVINSEKSLNLLFEMFEKQSFAFCIKNLPLESQAGPFLKELNDFPINHHFPYFSSRSWRLSLCSFLHKAFEIFNLDGVGKPLPAPKWSCDLTFPQWCAKVWNGYLIFIAFSVPKDVSSNFNWNVINRILFL